MSRAFGSANLKAVGLLNTPNVLNLSTPPDHESTINSDQTPETFTTEELIQRYNTPKHQSLYQTFDNLDELSILPHDPPIRISKTKEVFNIKSLTLGSDGLYETIPTDDMTAIPIQRFHQIQNFQQNQQELLHNEDFDEAQHKLPLCFLDPALTGLKPRTKPLHSGFDSKWNSSPSDALVSQVFSKYHVVQDSSAFDKSRRRTVMPMMYRSDNISAIVTFFSQNNGGASNQQQEPETETTKTN